MVQQQYQYPDLVLDHALRHLRVRHGRNAVQPLDGLLKRVGRLPFLAVLACGLVLTVTAGCGGSGETAAPAGSGDAGSSAVETGLTAPDEDLYAPLMQACLADRGYAATILPDGGINVRYADDDADPEVVAQAQADYEVAHEACLAETGFDRPSGITPEEDYAHVIAVDDCVREQGYPIVSPTFEEFTAGIFPENAGLLPQDGAELEELFALCESWSGRPWLWSVWNRWREYSLLGWSPGRS